MLEYNYSSSTHTHLVTSSGVQIELINKEPHNISMSFTSCTVEHGFSIIVRSVDQRLHLSSQVMDGVDTSTRCSFVQGILSILECIQNV